MIGPGTRSTQLYINLAGCLGGMALLAPPAVAGPAVAGQAAVAAAPTEADCTFHDFKFGDGEVQIAFCGSFEDFARECGGFSYGFGARSEN